MGRWSGESTKYKYDTDKIGTSTKQLSHRHGGRNKQEHKMSLHVTQQSEIPDAPFYVTTTDTFMSGWGRAENLVNRLILPCESSTEANRVADYARGRSDQKNVRICTTKPRIRPGTYTQVMDPEKSTAWYGRE